MISLRNWDSIILLHGELVNSNFDVLRSEILGFAWLLWLLEMSPIPYSWCWLIYFLQIDSKWFKKDSISENIICGNFIMPVNKSRVPNLPLCLSCQFSKIFNMGSISSDNMNSTVCIFSQMNLKLNLLWIEPGIKPDDLETIRS